MNYLALQYSIESGSAAADEIAIHSCQRLASEIQNFQRIIRVQRKRLEITDRTKAYELVGDDHDLLRSSSTDGCCEKSNCHDNDKGKVAIFSGHSDTTKNRVAELEKEFYSPAIKEVVIWQINCKGGYKIFDSKLYFFAGVLWRASFGLNKKHCNYYYIVVSPAQLLSQSCKVKCEFHLSCPHNSSEEPFIRKQNGNYLFPADTVKHKGFDRFISRDELHRFLSSPAPMGSRDILELRITMATDIGVNGELLGCTEVKKDAQHSDTAPDIDASS